MVERFFTRSCTIHGLRQGPLAGHIDLLADHLTAHGFSRVHSRIQLRLVGHFNRWLEPKVISAEQLDEKVIERYCRWLRHRKRVRAEDVCSLVRLLDLLREQRITPRCTTKAVPTAREISPVQLMEMPVEIPPLHRRGLHGWLRRQARAHLSSETKDAMRQAAKKIGLSL